jgi:predicted nucleotidyltransferase
MQNKDMFRTKYHITRIGVFGSYARGDQNAKSDIDLMVDFEENTENLYELKEQLREFIFKNLKLKADICRAKYIKPRYKESILNETIYAD